MSLCTWATVVSTVSSRSLHGVESRQIFGESGEPVPLPTFLSFLELLEELNRDETESSALKETKLFCQESFNSSLSSSDVELDKYLDLDGLNEEDIFENSAKEEANLGGNSHCSTSDWTSEHSSYFSLTSESFCCPDYFLPSAEILQYEDFESTVKSGLVVDKVFSDWSPELFEENIELTNKNLGETPLQTAECKHTDDFSGETLENATTSKCPCDASLQKAGEEKTCSGTPLNAVERKESEKPKAATCTHSGKVKARIFTALNRPQEPVKHKRKRKCTNCFERQESRSSCKSFGTTCRQVSVRQVIGPLCT